MRELIILGIAAWIGLPLPAQAQVRQDRLADTSVATDLRTGNPADCALGIAKARELNGPDLLRAAAGCFAAGKQVEGAFLLSAGQARAIADMTLMVPATKADSDAQTSLYGLLYFQAGGYGDDKTLRDPASRARLFGLMDGWSPAYGADYDPGWKTRRRPDLRQYQDAVREIVNGRRKQLEDIVRLLSDDVYYALHRRHNELARRNRNQFVEGTPEATLSAELLQKMEERAVVLGAREPAARAGGSTDTTFASPRTNRLLTNALCRAARTRQ